MKFVKGLNWAIALTLTVAFWLAFENIAPGLELGVAIGVAMSHDGPKH